MTTKRGLATPTIEVDNQVVAIKPNTLSYQNGDGELTVRPQIAGAGAIETVLTKDAETQRSMVKFSLITEAGNISLKDGWKRKSEELAGVAIRFSDEGFTRAFRAMRLINDPEIAIGVDADFELEFMGDPTA